MTGAVFDRDAGSMPEFVPVPAKLETGFGALEFTGGAYPTTKSAQLLFDELDLQRATQAYLDFYPALSQLGLLAAQARDVGARTCSDIGVFADFATSTALYLTANTDSVYATLTFDLGEDGPTVVEIPAGMYGPADDAYFRFIVDFGPSGPDQGKGGKYLFLPPGYEGDIPDGYFVIHSPTNRVWPMVRALPSLTGTGEQAIEWYRQNLKAYPLATGPREGRYINLTDKSLNTLAPEDGTAFDWLDDIIQHEPSDLFSPEQLGRLASLGIQKGKEFQPDERMRGILDQGAKQGAAMARAICFARRDDDAFYWPDRNWEVILSGGSDFMRDGFLDADARIVWHYQAIVVTPAMAGVTEGAGSAYLSCPRDANGEYLDGDKSYRLRVPPNVPAKQFWSVTVYDPVTRCLLQTDQPYPSINSWKDPVQNEDGSYTLHFGPEAPANADVNWIQTAPGKGWFAFLRLYGPLASYIDRSWVLDDIVETTSHSGAD